MVSQDDINQQAAKRTRLVVQLGQRPSGVVPLPSKQGGQVLRPAEAAKCISWSDRPANDGIVGMLGEFVVNGRKQVAAQLTQAREAQQTHLADKQKAMAVYRGRG